jgi:hypothetical protein
LFEDIYPLIIGDFSLLSWSMGEVLSFPDLQPNL